MTLEESTKAFIYVGEVCTMCKGRCWGRGCCPERQRGSILTL